MDCYRLTLVCPIGPVTVAATERGVAHVDFDAGARQDAREAAGLFKPKRGMPRHCADIEAQFNAYFTGTLTAFTLPLDIGGTPFTAPVLAAARGIPYGHTLVYSALARRLEDAYSARAIGRVLAANALPILIPCHRVVGKNGLGAYAGGAEIKEALLRLEGAL